MAMFDVITIGDIKLDTFVLLPDASVQCQLKMPECQLCIDYGKKIPVEVVDSQIAGSAPNVAVGLSRMALKTAVISMMGIDGTRETAMRKLAEEKVSTKYIRVLRHELSAYSVVLNFKGEKTILAAQTHHAYRLPRDTRSKWLYMGELGSGYENLYRSVAAFVRDRRIALGFNPGAIQIQERKKFLFDLIKQTYVLFVNVEEAQAITKETTTEIHRLATALWHFGAKQIVITDGKNGAYAFDGKELRACPIFPGRLVEATGAGDAFATGFIGALLNGQLHDEALRWGAVNSASVVGHIGPTAGLLSAGQIRLRLKKHSSFKTQLL